MAAPLRLRMDIDPAIDALREALALFAELPESSPEVFQLVVDLFESGFQFGLVEVDVGAAVVTNEMVIRLNPSERFLGLLAALRAGNINLSVIEHFKLSIVGGVVTPMMTERPGGVESSGQSLVDGASAVSIAQHGAA